MGEVGTLCSGLPGCCSGRRQGGGAGRGEVGERVVGNPPCARSTGMVCVCLDHLRWEEMDRVLHFNKCVVE